MAKNARLNWTLPTTRESGLPLAESEIAEVQIEMSADLGVNFVSVAVVAPPVLEALVSDLDAGDYVFKAIVVDNNGRRSADSASVQANVPDDSPPSEIADLTVTIE